MVGFNGPAKWRDVHLFWLPALLIPASLSNLLLSEMVGSLEPAELAAGFARGLSVAFLEETTFRGLALAILICKFHSTRRQIIGSVLLSSLIFGLAHLPNDPNWESFVAQWVSAALTGVGLPLFC